MLKTIMFVVSKVFITVFCFSKCQTQNVNIYNDFLIFLRTKNLHLIEGTQEFNKTLTHFKENVKIQQQLNQDQPTQSAKYGVTKFSHLSQQEFKDLYLSDMLWQPDKTVNQSIVTSTDSLRQLDVPQKLDWRSYLNFTIISPIKNQKKCGGCWAFSTVETVESMYSKKTGRPPPALSVQQVIDCSTNNDGCRGGDTCNAFSWIIDTNTGLVSDSLYPLTDMSDSCTMMPPGTPGVHAKSYKCFNNNGKEDETIRLLQKGPVAAAVDATTWANYQGGIIQYHCGKTINHAIQIVGYDLTGDVPFYIVRNSWGTDYGHDGYLYIKIRENVCGIASRVSTVMV